MGELGAGVKFMDRSGRGRRCEGLTADGVGVREGLWFEEEGDIGFQHPYRIVPGCQPAPCHQELIDQYPSHYTLTVIYNEALKSSNVSQLIKQHMPTAWKEANVTPVFKNGNEACVENYRPISLLCILLNVLEGCVYNRIYDALSSKIAEMQHGLLN